MQSSMIYKIIKVIENVSFIIINGIEYEFGRAEGVRKSDKANVINCGEWDYNDCWIVLGDGYSGIENARTGEIKIV